MAIENKQNFIYHLEEFNKDPKESFLMDCFEYYVSGNMGDTSRHGKAEDIHKRAVKILIGHLNGEKEYKNLLPYLIPMFYNALEIESLFYLKESQFRYLVRKHSDYKKINERLVKVFFIALDGYYEDWK